MIKWNLTAIGLCGLMLLGGCNVGSDDGQQTTSSASQAQTAATTSVQGSPLKPALTQTSSPVTSSSTSNQTGIHYLVLHGVNAAGEHKTNTLSFQKRVNESNGGNVQLVWFEPNRQADGSCLQDLSGYELEYGRQPNEFNTKLHIDLASPDMACATVGANECGDVRECRYRLSL